MIPESTDSSSNPISGQRANRRVFIGAAAAAALAGLGVALWRNGGESTGGPSAGVADAVWSQQWLTPTGEALPMQTFFGRPLLLNFWATWCPPCVEELPLINAFYRQNKANGWQVLGLAVDKVSPVQIFLQKMPLDFPIGMAGLGGAELGRNLGNLTGGLPFTVVFGADGVVLHRKMGRVTAEDLDAWVRLK
jgi:thiol-disulfide isomerase/thioredoxin